ncbi:16S rRNA processing protein RimM [Geothermobacter hydrogeniphilus]|uniref:Ribosome maturation factor RimM n=1 Tax=Geothermobacter hydrogeniphilus TaxID=1969733 RepID=A0A2K2H5N1_9BACT|nr:16S rRNA processing protein RimM [Geothermobacter hydrogeniphilus]
MQPLETALRPLGRVIGTHGLRGDLKIKGHPGNQAALLAAPRIYLRQNNAGSDCLTVRRIVPGRGWLRVSLREIDRIERAEPLVGAEVLVDPASLQREDGDLFWFELEGLDVIDAGRGPIGRLEEMFETGAHAVYVVRGRYGEVLIPAVPEFIGAVDLERGTLQVDVPEGLFPDNLGQ